MPRNSLLVGAAASRRARASGATILPFAPPAPRSLPPHLHDADCACCSPPPGPAGRLDRDATGNDIAAMCLAGLALGLMLAKLIDWWVAGPGVSAMFGAWS